MFLKNANTNKTVSITTQLTLFYTVATFFIISVIALFLYGTTIHVLHKANYHFLSDEIDILKKLLKKKPANRLALEQEIIEVPDVQTGSIYHYFIRILDENRKNFLETPEMETVFKNASFFNKKMLSQINESMWWQENGRYYLLMQSPVQFVDTTKTWTIQVALDISDQQVIIKNYRLVLFLSLIIGTIFAIMLGYVIARKGMKCLYELTDATKKITANLLHQRIELEFWPTELKTLGMAFNEMLNRIEISFSHLNQFSADIAHELRTPVNNLMGQTEILLARHGSIEEYQQVLGSNLEELHRISQIIDNLLFIARAENLQLDIKKIPLNVGEEIKLICDYYQTMADEKNIKITCDGSAILNADAIMFKRMVSNFLSNAIKFTPDNGLISILIVNMPEKVHITIQDNGVGIAKEHIAKIFKRFYRVDTARSQCSGGAGLGLAIAKSIIDLHQGTVWVSSQAGQGTSISLFFPT